MGCPPVRGDNPRALASGLSYVQVDNPWYNYYIAQAYLESKAQCCVTITTNLPIRARYHIKQNIPACCCIDKLSVTPNIN